MPTLSRSSQTETRLLGPRLRNKQLLWCGIPGTNYITPICVIIRGTTRRSLGRLSNTRTFDDILNSPGYIRGSETAFKWLTSWSLAWQRLRFEELANAMDPKADPRARQRRDFRSWGWRALGLRAFRGVRYSRAESIRAFGYFSSWFESLDLEGCREPH